MGVKQLQKSAIMSLEDLQHSLDNSPFHKLFMMKIVEADIKAQRLSIRQQYTPTVERQAGTRQYHGGVIASLIDIAGDYALVHVLGWSIPTINFRVDYLRPAIDTDLMAMATVRRAGKTIGVVDVDVSDDKERLIAVGRGCYSTSMKLFDK